MPSYEINPLDSRYKRVLTNQSRNYQMFAYCPALSRQHCGISGAGADDKDMRLYATEYTQTVYSKQMRYVQGPNIQVSKNGSKKAREYDFCHY